MKSKRFRFFNPQRLEELRGEAGRPESLTAMTPDEVSGEKLDVQRALVYLESVHGKPNTREDKAMVQHIYQRYRLLKRLVARAATTNAGIANALSTSVWRFMCRISFTF